VRQSRFFFEGGGFVTKRMFKRFRFVQDEKTDFERFFKKYYKIPYDNWSRLNHRNLDYIMRLENLKDDFSGVLNRIDIRQIRLLLRYNLNRKKNLPPNLFLRGFVDEPNGFSAPSFRTGNIYQHLVTTHR
jgi:hypothetical protein